jgi:hypothetical protein
VSNTWFTSDVHIGHRLVAELRGFGDVLAVLASRAAARRHRAGCRDDLRDRHATVGPQAHPYRQVLDAALNDAGYLDAEGE